MRQIYNCLNFEAANRKSEHNTRPISIAEFADVKRRYLKVQEENSKLKIEINRTNKSCRDLECALGASKKSLKYVQSLLDESAKEATLARKTQIGAEEKFRRQAEILSKTTTELDDALQESQKLTFQQMKLQKWTEQSDDDEISQAMGNLCQELEAWVKHHFPPSALFGHGIYWLCADVSHRMTALWLSRVLVGVVGDDLEAHVLSQAVRILDQKVVEICK